MPMTTRAVAFSGAALTLILSGASLGLAQEGAAPADTLASSQSVLAGLGTYPTVLGDGGTTGQTGVPTSFYKRRTHIRFNKAKTEATTQATTLTAAGQANGATVAYAWTANKGKRVLSRTRTVKWTKAYGKSAELHVVVKVSAPGYNTVAWRISLKR